MIEDRLKNGLLQVARFTKFTGAATYNLSNLALGAIEKFLHLTFDMAGLSQLEAFIEERTARMTVFRSVFPWVTLLDEAIHLREGVLAQKRDLAVAIMVVGPSFDRRRAGNNRIASRRFGKLR